MSQTEARLQTDDVPRAMGAGHPPIPLLIILGSAVRQWLWRSRCRPAAILAVGLRDWTRRIASVTVHKPSRPFPLHVVPERAVREKLSNVSRHRSATFLAF